MNELINGNAIKMTSIEIAELVGSRHDKVKQSIERLAARGVIRNPPMVVFEKINNLGLLRGVEAYVFEGEQGKRDSIIVVAQLSPEFTARLVDRWRELEEAAVNIPKTLPEALRLAADLAEQKMQLENQLAIAAPKVEFADRVGEASGILIGNFAKVVGIGPNKLFAWMRGSQNPYCFRYPAQCANAGIYGSRLFHSERNSGQHKSRNTDIVHHKNHRAWSTVADQKAAR